MSTGEGTTRFEAATAAFRARGGILRMTEALDAGIHRRTLYELRERGIIEQLSRGLYRLAEASPLGNPDLVAVARRVPRGVVCLISALAFHELTDEIPHEVYLAVPRASEPPRIDYPPVRVFRFNPATFEAGVETHRLDGVPVRVYGPEKTLADCFKYRNKIGLDTAVKALRAYHAGRKRIDVGKLMQFAEVCRVKGVMLPYVEAIL
jgi:predicted transcriptional regulator of viral defense system